MEPRGLGAPDFYSGYVQISKKETVVINTYFKVFPFIIANYKSYK